MLTVTTIQKAFDGRAASELTSMAAWFGSCSTDFPVLLVSPESDCPIEKTVYKALCCNWRNQRVENLQPDMRIYEGYVKDDAGKESPAVSVSYYGETRFVLVPLNAV